MSRHVVITVRVDDFETGYEAEYEAHVGFLEGQLTTPEAIIYGIPRGALLYAVEQIIAGQEGHALATLAPWTKKAD